jgi:hypothetical protein
MTGLQLQWRSQQQRCWSRPLIVFVSLLFLVQVADAQRVIASLGTRLKRLHNKSGSKKIEGDYVVRGEEGAAPTVVEYLESFAQENNVELFVAGSVLMITIYLLSFWNKTKQQKGEEGEFSHRRDVHFLLWFSWLDENNMSLTNVGFLLSTDTYSVL